jgi:nitrile hydratase beta subunit
MNGIHDMGGMQGFGPIQPEKDEPVFHARWEGRVLAMRRAVAATGKLPPLMRPSIESLPPLDYLRMSYYEKWYAALVEQLVGSGLVTHEEIASGKPAMKSIKAVPTLKSTDAAKLPFQLPPGMLTASVMARFTAGQHVRARNMNPDGHTRLPRYARGRTGMIERDQGVQAFADTHVYGRGQNPQHVYSVRFAARELWGEQASVRDSVYIDLSEDYLEPA